MTLLEILGQVNSVKNELVAGHYVGALRATLPLQAAACDILESQGLRSAVGDDATKDQIRSALTECQELCDSPPPQREAVSAIFPRDGAIIKLILQTLQTLLPLFIK